MGSQLRIQTRRAQRTNTTIDLADHYHWGLWRPNAKVRRRPAEMSTLDETGDPAICTMLPAGQLILKVTSGMSQTQQRDNQSEEYLALPPNMRRDDRQETVVMHIERLIMTAPA